MWWGHVWATPGTYVIFHTQSYTDQVSQVSTTISCLWRHTHGSTGLISACAYNEVSIFITLRLVTEMTEMTKKLKSRPWEWLGKSYRNLVIPVILVTSKGRADVIHLPCQYWVMGLADYVEIGGFKSFRVRLVFYCLIMFLRRLFINIKCLANPLPIFGFPQNNESPIGKTRFPFNVPNPALRFT